MFDKFMFPDMEPAARKRAMRDSCDGVKVDQTVRRALTDEELRIRREEFPDKRIAITAALEHKKATLKALTAEIKKLEAESDQMQTEIHHRQTTRIEDVFVFFDIEAKEAYEYAAETGERLVRRAMNADEKQSTIMHVERRASNG